MIRISFRWSTYYLHSQTYIWYIVAFYIINVKFSFAVFQYTMVTLLPFTLMVWKRAFVTLSPSVFEES